MWSDRSGSPSACMESATFGATMNSDNVPVQVPDRAGYAVPRQRQPPAAFTRCSFATSAQQLLVELVTEPLGRLSPSVYETGRLVTLAPWLVGHAARVACLLDS